MRQFLLAETADGGKFLVEWDEEAGEVVVCIPNNPILRVHEAKIKTGIVGTDVIEWRGQVLTVLQHVHLYLKREFPAADLKATYVAADEWCVRKGKKIKNTQTFLMNWLKKDTNAGRHRSGVML